MANGSDYPKNGLEVGRDERASIDPDLRRGLVSFDLFNTCQLGGTLAVAKLEYGSQPDPSVRVYEPIVLGYELRYRNFSLSALN
jgi:hypothetical protein